MGKKGAKEEQKKSLEKKSPRGRQAESKSPKKPASKSKEPALKKEPSGKSSSSARSSSSRRAESANKQAEIVKKEPEEIMIPKKKADNFKVPDAPKALSESKSSDKVVPPSSLLEFNKLVGSLLMPASSTSSTQSSSFKQSDS